MLDVYALKVFLEAAKIGSFTDAAEALNVTQPAVSHHIKSLEDFLQVPLFERVGRRVQLTQAGQSLVPLAQQAVHLVMGIEDTMRNPEGKVEGDLTIGCSEPSVHYLLPHLMARFKRIYPDVSISISVVSQEALLQKIVHGECDLGIAGTRYLRECNLHSIELYQDQFVLVAPTDHLWAQRQVISPSELASEPFVCCEAHSTCRRAVGSALAKLGFDIGQMRVVMETGSPEGQAMAVEHGIGMSFMPLVAAIQRLPMGRLAIIQVDGIMCKNAVYLVYSTARAPSPVQEQFVKFLNIPQTQLMIDTLAQGVVN